MAHLKPCRDHKGTAFPSIKAMTKAWDVPYTRYRERRRKGWSLQESLETPLIPIQYDRKGLKAGRRKGVDEAAILRMAATWKF